MLTTEQLATIRTAQKQLIDLGDEKTAATLAWALTAEPIPDGFRLVPAHDPLFSIRLDAARYRWLRQQHEGRTEQELNADGVPMPTEPTAVAFTVFRPGEVGECHLEPVGCMPGELDGRIDTAMAIERSTAKES